MVHKLAVRTHQQTEFIDITDQIQTVVTQSGVRDGIAVIWVPHTTAGITINEHADPDVARDILKELNKVIPFTDNYAHLEGNSAAHIKSTLVGCQTNVMVEDGRLLLGTWQGIFFCEFDGPRHRSVWVKILPE